MHRRSVLLGGCAALLSGCSRNWTVDHGLPLDPAVAKTWNVTDVQTFIPADLTVSNANTFAPNADIVWHGEPFGNRATQVARILKEGIEQGSANLNGPRPVIITASLREFHAVTPTAVSQAPGAVHNIRYNSQVVDAKTGAPLIEPVSITADLEAYVQAAAVTAAIDGNTQRNRIVNHLARVTASWLGTGPDQRREFRSIGR